MSQIAAKKEQNASVASRPFVLAPLFRRITDLPGIGPRNAKLFERLCGGEKIFDILCHLPIDIIDRRFAPDIKDAPDGRIVTLTVAVDKHTPNPRKGLPYRVRCHDSTGSIDLVFFHAHKDYISKQLPVGATVIVSGKIEYYRGAPQMVHPDAIGPEEDREIIQNIEPVYPLTQGITTKTVRKAISNALGFISPLDEWLDIEFKKRKNWPDWHEAIKNVHAPKNETALEPYDPSRERLAYDELLANQLALSMVRYHARKQQGRIFNTGGELRDKLLRALPFELTNAQKQSIAEIDDDMGSKIRMLRLLQGDVGSGKTVIAALAALNAISTGSQAAIMAPTEILARQHAESLRPWLEECGIRYVVLTGRDKGKGREVIAQQIRNGAAQIVIGTHSLFQDDVEFADLGLAIIDEQHRFGVQQRLKLSDKGKDVVDVLVMTATPIPRTLTLTAYGDMDVSRLDEKPPGRKPIDTRLISHESMEAMLDGLKRKIAAGDRVYWVCPLVEESEILDLAAAEERYEILQANITGSFRRTCWAYTWKDEACTKRRNNVKICQR
jgi:ATP-dependent DNA helicase RecG